MIIPSYEMLFLLALAGLGVRTVMITNCSAIRFGVIMNVGSLVAFRCLSHDKRPPKFFSTACAGLHLYYSKHIGTNLDYNASILYFYMTLLLHK